MKVILFEIKVIVKVIVVIIQGHIEILIEKLDQGHFII